ncbi:hypothetical protein OG562_18175 [Streptomyces sp. NBC_01275]|uniref:hypothetical protein n=1 Tax=Streptomyces sp. NBC_01275 TaxID=2903807 RepID=UPI0022504021|nr:hypothetical protein [Streptomyces sp. NBC_01275]MCX4762867.1 hypothetical protein [Streptomyces sp. NBC_01275]
MATVKSSTLFLILAAVIGVLALSYPVANKLNHDDSAGRSGYNSVQAGRSGYNSVQP